MLDLMTFGKQILDFYASLQLPDGLPDGVQGMEPWKNQASWSLMNSFFEKYYDDNMPRTLLMGINPGRLGSGITGIPFTDPVVLEEHCGLTNTYPKKRELSSEFIFLMIDALGGPEVFYRNFYISAMSPIGFLQNGKNMNYYDSNTLLDTLQEFMRVSLRRQLQLPLNHEKAFSVGKGKNIIHFRKLNTHVKAFKIVDELPHPRWVMQYRRKHIQVHLEECIQKLGPFIQNDH